MFQNDVISCAQQVELLEQQLATRMEQLQATVQSKTAVPTAQVYVSFNINGEKKSVGHNCLKSCVWKVYESKQEAKKESFMTYVRHK